MTRAITTVAAVLLVVGSWMVADALSAAARAYYPTHPRVSKPCPEDAVIMGFGAYSHGFWTRYRCIAADDVMDAR